MDSWTASRPRPVHCRCTDEEVWRRKRRRRYLPAEIFLLLEGSLSWIGWVYSAHRLLFPHRRNGGRARPPYRLKSLSIWGREADVIPLSLCHELRNDDSQW